MPHRHHLPVTPRRGALLALALVAGLSAPAAAQNVTPQAYAAQVLNNPAANLQTSIDQGVLNIEYTIDPVALTKGAMRAAFYAQVARITPGLFARFPSIHAVRITARHAASDEGGKTSLRPAMAVRFSREKADKVPWLSASPETIAAMADESWTSQALP